MKAFFIIFWLLIHLSSCVFISELQLFNESSSNILEDGSKEFIELNDGKKIEIKSSSLKVKGFSDSKKIYIYDGIVYEFKKIIAIQKGNSYYRKIYSNKFLVKRIIKGKINIYLQEFPAHTSSHYNTTTNRFSDTHYKASYFYYLQKGDQSPVLNYSDKLFEEMISDSPEALTKFNDYKNMSKKQKKGNVNVIFDKVISAYNRVE